MQNNSIFWVLGHVDVKGNEIADGLAKKGAGGTRMEPDALPSIIYLERKIKDYIFITWNTKWKIVNRRRCYTGQQTTKPSAPLL